MAFCNVAIWHELKEDYEWLNRSPDRPCRQKVIAKASNVRLESALIPAYPPKELKALEINSVEVGSLEPIFPSRMAFDHHQERQDWGRVSNGRNIMVIELYRK